MRNLIFVFALSFDLVTGAVEQADPESIDSVVETLHTISQMSSTDEAAIKKLLSQPLVRPSETMIRLIRCLWIIQDAPEGPRSPMEERYYTATWIALNDLLGRDEPTLNASLEMLIDHLQLDGGERLAFEEKLAARQKRLAASVHPK